MLTNDCCAAGGILDVPARVRVICIVGSCESVTKVAEDHHDVKFPLPVFFLLLEAGGFGESFICLGFDRVVIFDTPLCGVFFVRVEGWCELGGEDGAGLVSFCGLARFVGLLADRHTGVFIGYVSRHLEVRCKRSRMFADLVNQNT